MCAKRKNVVDVSKEEILLKTHRGLTIYAHILRQYYPEETVLSLRGRICLPTRNPFNEDRPTLNIQFQNGIAIHTDSENKIPTGDCFDFAMFHYLMDDQKLLDQINLDLKLRIGVKHPFYDETMKQKTELMESKIVTKQFSYFNAPITNIQPKGTVTILEVYRFISNNYKKETEQLRSINDPAKARAFKATKFQYVTFSGSFSKRNDIHLIEHSGLMALDFDHVLNTAELKEILLNDPYFDTELLFISPSGDGLKWIISIDTTTVKHRDFFKAVSNYLKATYSLEPDPSGKDISRACFLPHDPEAFINPKYL